MIISGILNWWFKDLVFAYFFTSSKTSASLVNLLATAAEKKRAMEGLSDNEADRFSDVELKNVTSGGNDEISIDAEVETQQTKKPKPKVSFKMVGKAISKFLGVPDERNLADYDVTHPTVTLIKERFNTISIHETRNKKRHFY